MVTIPTTEILKRVCVLSDGFFVVAKGGKYYKEKGEFVLEKEDAYHFMLKHLAERLADRIGGKMEGLM